MSLEIELLGLSESRRKFLFIIEECLFRANSAVQQLSTIPLDSSKLSAKNLYDEAQLEETFNAIEQDTTKAFRIIEKQIPLYAPTSEDPNSRDSEFNEKLTLRKRVDKVHDGFHTLFGMVFKFICNPQFFVTDGGIIVDFCITYIDHVLCRDEHSSSRTQSPDHLDYIQVILLNSTLGNSNLKRLYNAIFAHYLHFEHREAWYKVFNDLFDRCTKSVETGRQALNNVYLQ